MKTFLRSLCGFLLFTMLISFTLWRHEAFPDLSSLTGKVQQAAGHINKVVTVIKKGGTDDSLIEESQKPVDPDGAFAGYDLTTPLDGTLEAALVACLQNMQESVDISAFNLTRDAANSAVAQVRYTHPEFFYVSDRYQMTYGGGKVISYIPQYTKTPTEVVGMRAEYNAALEEIAAGISPTASDFDKVLYLHDYFVREYTYDHSLTIRDAHTLFTQKTGVCQAYMLGFIAACNVLGVESLPVTSEVMTHAWNLVKVDGEWYHVDTTWDDSGVNPAFTSYTYFLQSDSGLAAIDADRAEMNRHRGWSAAEAAGATRYDDAVWKNSNTPIVKYGNTYYCAVESNDVSKTARGHIYKGENPLEFSYDFDIKGGYWSTGAGSYYPGCYSGLLLDGDVLYYNCGNTIYGRNLKTDTLVFTYSPMTLALGQCIYGLTGIKDGTLTFTVARSPSDEHYIVASCPVSMGKVA